MRMRIVRESKSKMLFIVLCAECQLAEAELPPPKDRPLLCLRCGDAHDEAAVVDATHTEPSGDACRQQRFGLSVAPTVLVLQGRESPTVMDSQRLPRSLLMLNNRKNYKLFYTV